MSEMVVDIKEKLQKAGLKLTPQRIAILEAIHKLDNHPTAENIRTFIKDKYPGIAIGTIYKVLDTFVEKKLIKKVKTENDVMKYDSIIEQHHHLYCVETDRIEDYQDSTIDDYLKKYFELKKIPNFQINEIILQINGKFI